MDMKGGGGGASGGMGIDVSLSRLREDALEAGTGEGAPDAAAVLVPSSSSSSSHDSSAAASAKTLATRSRLEYLP